MTNRDEVCRNRKVLITGGLGFIGSRLAIRPVEEGTYVTLVDSHLPQTESPCRRILTLPMYPELTDHQVDRVFSALQTWCTRR